MSPLAHHEGSNKGVKNIAKQKLQVVEKHVEHNRKHLSHFQNLNTYLLEVTTTIKRRKRGRPISQMKTIVNSMDVSGVDRSNKANKSNGREQRQASKVTELDDRTSSIKHHFSSRTSCRKLYSDDIFSILTRGRSKLHLAVWDQLYIRKLVPELGLQKENVLSLQLFFSSFFSMFKPLVLVKYHLDQ